MLMIAMFNIVVGFIFKDQIVILDALDSAVTSSLFPSEEIIRPTFYYELLNITGWVTIDGTNFPTTYEWVNKENGGKDLAGYSGNYIRLNKDDAYNKGFEYFNKYLDFNNANVTIEDFTVDVEYDEDRLVPVINARWYTPKSTEWWHSEFGDSGTFTFPNQLIYVRFPRWVKTTIDTTLEIPIPFGIGLATMIDADESNFKTITKRYISSGIKEIKVMNPPPIYGWE